MTDVTRLEASVTTDERYVAFPYRDTRKLWTFGKGRCVETHPLSAAEWKQMLDSGWLSISVSLSGADWLMRRELAAVEAQLAKDYADFWPHLNDARQNALIEMAYQMGVEKEEGFHQMLAAIRAGNWQEAYNQALASDWAKQTPARAKMIATMILTGSFP